MATIFDLKELEIVEAPLLLFDCVFLDGTIEHWSTRNVTINGATYSGRVGKHNLFEVQTASDQAVDSIPRISLDLANADSHFSELEQNSGFKGARLNVSFVFFDLKKSAPASEVAVLFKGISNPPELITESSFRFSAINRLAMQRVFLPPVRIQRRCAWSFPRTLEERTEGSDGGERGKFSRFYGCGYSPDVPGGTGNTVNGVPFTSCSYTRSDCEARGMFSTDSQRRTTSRFSGIEFVPSTITVRTSGDKNTHLSPVSMNQTRYNDFAPLVYGTAWISPEIVFARNDGNLTRMEVLLGLGEIQTVHKVIVNNIEIPAGRSGQNMTGTGWYNVVTSGTRAGAFNRDFTDAKGAPLGDPYGGMAYLSVVVPNKINDGQTLPSIQTLLDGIKLHRYSDDGSYRDEVFTNNPCWVILDLLLRNGWTTSEIDLQSFAAAADYCDSLIETKDLLGNTVKISRFQCNLVLQARRSAADVLRGIRKGSRLFLTFGFNGLLQVKVENTIGQQAPVKPQNSNARDALGDGWPAYEFGDGTDHASGILRNPDGSSTLRLSKHNASDSPNRFSVEFQDSFNEYQQDSFSLVDEDDVAKTVQEINAALAAFGLPNYDQAARIVKFNLDKSISGNLFIEFQTSVKALGLSPGDIITVTYLKENLTRTPFRVLKIVPGLNYRTVTITAQVHDDAWYADDNGQTSNSGGRRIAGYGIGLPRPVTGSVPNIYGDLDMRVVETGTQAQDGTATLLATVICITPAAVVVAGPAIPLISLTAIIDSTAGKITGNQTLYYALSANDKDGNESPLSFIVTAAIPADSDTNQVSLQGLSFSASTVSFNVYRGPSPGQLLRVANSQAPQTGFSDAGLAPNPILPPDANFDHVNCYWRLELQPAANATTSSGTSIGSDALSMIPNEYSGMIARIIHGTGFSQERTILTNDLKTLTLGSAWDILPDATSVFVVSQSSFQFGATSVNGTLQFAIPDRPDAIIQISARSATANNVECPYELSPLTRWKIGGSGIKLRDADVAATPTFGLGLSPTKGGTLDFAAIGFSDLTNTSSITAATYTLYIYDELSGTPSVSLFESASSGTSLLVTNTPVGAQAGSYVQIDGEILLVSDVSADGKSLSVASAQLKTSPADHAAGTLVYLLSKRVVIVPFIRNFFGTPASGSWSYSVSAPNVRLAAAELFVTNSQGNSQIAVESYTGTVDLGLRTLSGGQYSFQIAGFLSVQTGAAPDVYAETSHVVRDVFAIVAGAPVDDAIQLNLNLNDDLLCSLAIPSGLSISTSVSGLTLPVLNAGDRISLDVVNVGSSQPGNDLSVIIRM